MNNKDEAPIADICLLLEGTWPYVLSLIHISEPTRPY